MTTKKLSDGVVKDFQVGDRVVWDKAGNSIYEVVKISGEGITISLLKSHPQKIQSPAKQRVSLDEIEPLDIGSNTQNHTKSSRGFGIGGCIKHSTSGFLSSSQVYQELEECSYNLTSVAGSAQVSYSQDLSPEDSSLKDCVKSINSATTDCAIAFLASPSTPTCDNSGLSLERQTLLQPKTGKCQVIIKADICQLIKSCQPIESQRLQQNIGNFTGKDLVVKMLPKPLVLLGNQSGMFSEIMAMTLEGKSSFPSLSLKESVIRKMMTATTDAQSASATFSCTELFGKSITEKYQRAITFTTLTETRQITELKTLIVSRHRNTENYTEFLKNTGISQENSPTTLVQSEGLIQEMSIFQRVRQPQQLEKAQQPFHKRLETEQNQQELTGSTQTRCLQQSIYAVELEQVFLLQDSSPEDFSLKDYANKTNTVNQFSSSGFLKFKFIRTLENCPNSKESTAFVGRPPVNLFPLTANAEVQQMSAIVSPQCCIPLVQRNQASLPLKTSQDSSPVPCSPAIPLGHISAIFSGRYSRAGTMHSGFVSVADTLERPSLENGYCWLESPNALSSTGKGRPPGQSRLEAQLKKLGVLESREVLNPQFLEKTYNLPLDWTNPQELRAATELLEDDVQHSAIASIPELQVSPSAASSTLIPSVNNYSPLVLGESNLYASVFPLELKSDDRERNKKVLGDFNYLAPVIPLELKRRRSLVQEKTNSYAFVLPLELEQEQSLVLGDNQSNLFPLEIKPTIKRKASGWLERYTKTKKVKGGNSVTYPRVEGEREPNNSEHWYWAYRWEEKRDTAKSNNGYVTRAVSLPKNKVEAVQIAIARKWSQEKILNFIRG